MRMRFFAAINFEKMLTFVDIENLIKPELKNRFKLTRGWQKVGKRLYVFSPLNGERTVSFNSDPHLKYKKSGVIPHYTF